MQRGLDRVNNWRNYVCGGNICWGVIVKYNIIKSTDTRRNVDGMVGDCLILHSVDHSGLRTMKNSTVILELRG